MRKKNKKMNKIPKIKKKLSAEAYNLLFNATKEERYYLCSLDPKYFAIYYFPEYFDYKIPEFHLDFYDDARRLMYCDLKELAWIAFRESAKTSIAKIMVVWAICYRLKRYINVDSYDISNAEAFVFDVALALQTNPRIIEDFGQLYYRKNRKLNNEEEGATMKRLAQFITENRVKVQAYSTQESTRGRLYGIFRPDLYILDDIENSKTKDSPAIRNKIIEHYNELKSGLSTNGGVLTLGNLIIDDGVIGTILEGISQNPVTAIARNIPVVGKVGIMWADKYVMTDKEAAELNKTITNPRKFKVSIEAKRRELTEPVFQAEMMNNPGKTGDYFFNRDIVKKALERAIPPTKISGEMKVWEDFNPMHSYGIGADTSEGVGRDSSTSVVIDFKIKKVVGTYKSNTIPPNVFAYELKRQGEAYGNCIVGPEINNTGFATIAELQNIYDNIYQRENKNKITDQVMNEYGFRTTVGNKYEVLGNFKTAFEDGDLDILDEDLLKEMYHYKRSDMNQMKAEEGMTKHFDLLMAAAIAWEMRKVATLSKGDPKRLKMYKSPNKKAEPLY